MTLFAFAGTLAGFGLLLEAIAIVMILGNMRRGFDFNVESHVLGMGVSAFGSLSLLAGFIAFCGYLVQVP